jgi:hypothetical protein
MNERRTPYAPRRLPTSIRRGPPTTLASRAAAGPYSLASDPLKEIRKRKDRRP